MSFKIMCPHCHKPITEKDFQENEQAIAHLQEFFNSQEAKYKQKLTDKLQNKWLVQQKATLQAQLKTQEISLTKEQQKVIDQLNLIKQKKLDELNKKIQALDIINKTNEQKIETEVNKKEVILNKQHQQIIDKLQLQINDLLTENKTNEQKIQTAVNANALQLNLVKQKELYELNKKIQALDIENKKFEAKLKTQLMAKELSVINEKQVLIDNIKDQHIKKENELNLQISGLILKLEQGRNIKSGILGSNLENDFEQKMNTFYLSDNFEKTTKPINGRKPDFMLSIKNPRNEKKIMGKLLFELKNQEKLSLLDVEDKLSKELQERNADFGLIIWAHAHAPFTLSKTHNNIFIVNTDFEILVLIVNILKMLVYKRFTLENQQEIKVQDEKMTERFKSWMENDFSKLIGKAMGEFDKFDKSICDLEKTSINLTKIKDNLKAILTVKIHNKLKTF